MFEINPELDVPVPSVLPFSVPTELLPLEKLAGGVTVVIYPAELLGRRPVKENVPLDPVVIDVETECPR